MTDDNPFYRLKAAAARQRQLSLALHDTSVLPEPSHPATELVRHPHGAPAPRVAPQRDLERAEPPGDVEGPTPVVAEEVDVVIEAEPDLSSAPWWAAKKVNAARGPFYPPVPITIPMEAPLEKANDGTVGLAAFLKRQRKGKGDAFFAHLSFECSRPRALLVLVGILALGIVGINAVANYRSSKVMDEQQLVRAEALKGSLALLDQSVPATPAAPPARNSQAAAGNASSFAATAAAASDKPDLSAASIEEYVRKAMPQLTGQQPAPGGQGATPREVQNRPLPSVAAAAATLPKKAPIGETIDESTPVPTSPVERPKRPGKQPKAAGPRSIAPAPSPAHADPLGNVMIRAAIVNLTAPFQVHEIREQKNTLGAYVLPLSSNDLGDGVWVNAGQVFANGWTLVGVERKQAVFLSPEGQVVRVRPTPVE